MEIANQFYLRLLNPYDPVYWAYEVKLPSEAAPIIVKPDYEIEHFLDVFAVEFLGYIEEGQTLHELWEVFKRIAVSLVDYEILGEDEDLWRYLVSLYIAHNMEMSMARMKNQADEISLTPEKPKEKKIVYTVSDPNSVSEALLQTKYGFAFWSAYKPYLNWVFKGIYTPGGYNE